MRRKPRDIGHNPHDDALDHLRTGALTWLGLGIAAIGWVGLLGEIVGVDVLPAKITRSGSPSLHADIVSLAVCIIGSGFALAVIGALQSGFGALNRFFGAVLMRSSQRTVTQPAHADPEPSVSPGKRPYRILADGSVEVETIVGTRRFASLAEARDFI